MSNFNGLANRELNFEVACDPTEKVQPPTSGPNSIFLAWADTQRIQTY